VNTGFFTAPVSGIYSFYCNVNIKTAGTGTFTVRKGTSAVPVTSSTSGVEVATGYNTVVGRADAYAIVEMNVTDTLTVYATTANLALSNNPVNSISIYLLRLL